MLTSIDVDQVAAKAAKAALKGVKLSKVYSTATTDTDGHDALNVTIVIASRSEKEVTGETALDAIVRIQRDLLKSGDERLAIVDFATEDELTLDGDT